MLELSWQFSLVAVGSFLIAQLSLVLPLSHLFKSIRSWRLGAVSFVLACMLTYILWSALVWSSPAHVVLGIFVILLSLSGGFIADTVRLSRGMGAVSFARAYIGGFSVSMILFWLFGAVAVAFIGAIAVANGLTLKQITLSRHVLHISMDVSFDGVTYPATTTSVRENTLFLGRQSSNGGWPHPRLSSTIRFSYPEVLSELPFDVFFNNSSNDTLLLVANRTIDGIREGYFSQSFSRATVITCIDDEAYCTRITPHPDQLPILTTEEIIARAGSRERNNGQDFSLNVADAGSPSVGLFGAFRRVDFYKELSFSFDTEHTHLDDIPALLKYKQLILSNPRITSENFGPLAPPGPDGNLWLSYIFYDRFAAHIRTGCNRTGYLAWWNKCIYQEDVFANPETIPDVEEQGRLRPIPE